MKLHKSRVVVINAEKDWKRFTTLCGRMNARCADGMNIADHDDDVTCKFCLALMGRSK